MLFMLYSRQVVFIKSLIFFLLVSINLVSQTEKECRKYFVSANQYFEEKKYNQAAGYVDKIMNSPKNILHDDIDFNFVAGTSYWFSDTSKLKAIPCFENYLKSSKEEIEVVIWLAKLYHLNYQYDKAKEKYIEYGKFIKSDERLNGVTKAKLLKEIERDIISCEYAKMLIINPSRAQIDHLGDSINSIYHEYAPVINKSESEIYFTRKSPENTGKKVNEKGEYFEDIYHSKILKGSLLSRDTAMLTGFVHITDSMQFSLAKNIGEPVNTESHDAAIQLTHNDGHLYIYKKNHIWLAEIGSDKKPQAPHQINELNAILNSGTYEPSVSINVKEDVIYFASERSGGFGGLDLYKTVKVNGVWQAAENLGPTVNTEQDEDSPYIDPDNTTLYFSSKGHSSMGGYDVFKTFYVDSSWMHPLNMGFPINGNSDDIFFIMPDKYNRAYFSSDRVGGKGKMDIYRISFADERFQLAEVRGKVKKGDKLLTAKSKLTVIDKQTDEAIAEYHSDTLTGDYHILLDHNNKYIVKVETEGFRAYKRVFTIPEQEDYYSFYQEIHHIHLKDKNGNIIGHTVNIYGLNPDKASLESLFETEAYLYITKDSLMSLMMEDSSMFGSYDEKMKLYFLNNESSSLVDESAKDLNELTLQMRKKRQMDYLNANGGIVTPLSAKDNEDHFIVFYFPFNEYKLNKEQTDSLSRYFRKLYLEKKTPLVRIEGHTDGIGGADYNKTLSYKRAKAAETTIQKSHPNLKNFSLMALAESVPLAEEVTADGKDNEEGRQKNRRVKITFLIETE